MISTGDLFRALFIGLMVMLMVGACSELPKEGGEDKVPYHLTCYSGGQLIFEGTAFDPYFAAEGRVAFKTAPEQGVKDRSYIYADCIMQPQQ